MNDDQDFSDKYNTKLSKDDEAEYQQWATDNGRTNDTKDYDMRGWWKDNNGAAAPGGHFTDKYKKPNHPTFSDESQYSGKDGYNGGTWGGTDEAPTFTPSQTNLDMHGRDGLTNYFSTTEPDTTLVLPKTKAEKRYGSQP